MALHCNLQLQHMCYSYESAHHNCAALPHRNDGRELSIDVHVHRILGMMAISIKTAARGRLGFELASSPNFAQARRTYLQHLNEDRDVILYGDQRRSDFLRPFANRLFAERYRDRCVCFALFSKLLKYALFAKAVWNEV